MLRGKRKIIEAAREWAEIDGEPVEDAVAEYHRGHKLFLDAKFFKVTDPEAVLALAAALPADTDVRFKNGTKYHDLKPDRIMQIFGDPRVQQELAMMEQIREYGRESVDGLLVKTLREEDARISAHVAGASGPEYTNQEDG